MTRATVDLSAPAGNAMPTLARRALAIAALWVAAVAMSPVSALVVMNYDPANNYVAPTPATNPGAWGSNADPGWANSTSRGVYLGNGWVLSAVHTGAGTSGRIEQINDEGFLTIDNSGKTLKNPTALVSAGVAQNSDLRLFRINSLNQFDGTPEQRAIALGKPLQPIHLTTSRLANNQQLVIVGRGAIKADGAALLHADTNYVNGQAPNWPSFTTCIDCFHTLGSEQLHAVGYSISQVRRQTWGTNRVENPTTVASSLSDFVSKGGAWVSGNTAVQAFDFDEYNFTTDASGNVIGGGGNEVQASGGDSGSGVYAWNTGLQRWELSGVMHSVATYSGLNRAIAIRRGTSPQGDLTVFSELSVYRTQIEAYMAPPVGYEWNGQGTDTRFFHMVGRNVAYDAAGSLVVTEGMWGDINLDGVVSGDGTGSWGTDDVTAFVQGWGYQQGSGDILSWKRGDMNQDGRVDLDDFLLLRQGVQQASGASLSLSALFGGSSQMVPEPATAGILAAAGLGLLAWRKLRRVR